MRWLAVYWTMLSRLQAEESLRRVMELQAATPEVEQRARERIVKSWQRLAEPEREAEKLTPDQLAVRLALTGIGIRKVKHEQ